MQPYPPLVPTPIKNNPVSGFNYLLRGVALLGHPGLRRYVVVPLLANIVVFSLIGWGGVELVSTLMERYLPEEGWQSYLRWLLWPLFVVVGALVTFYTFTVVANLIAAPFNGRLAEKVEALVTGQPCSAPGGGVLRDLLPATLSELRKLLYFLLRAIPLLILLLIPGVNLIAPFLWIAFSAWFLAIEYVDHPMGNSGLKFARELELMRKIRLTGLGFGGGVILLMTIPLVNFIAMPAAVIGATLLWCEQRDALTRSAG